MGNLKQPSKIVARTGRGGREENRTKEATFSQIGAKNHLEIE